MQRLTLFLQQLDFISNEVKLTFQKKNEIRLKTALGGLLCLISMSMVIGVCLYLFINLIQQGTIFVSNSTESSPYVNLSDTSGYPILLRLSNRNSEPFDSPESIYKIALKFWHGGSNNTMDDTLDKKEIEIEVEQCSLEKHFGDYRYLFATLPDLNTFFCPRLRYSNETIFGRYGDIYPYSYYHFTITMCINMPECLPIEAVKNITEGVYLDFRTIDHNIDNYHSQPQTETIKSDRISISSTVYKRVWVFYEQIEYITDKGILFPTETKDFFSQYESIRYDTDNRDISTGINAGIFASMSFLTTGRKSIYNRRYSKIQDFLASIGGITKFIEICAFIFNYCYSYNTYYLKMIKSLSLVHVLEINRKKGEFRTSKSTRLQTNNYIERTKIDLNDSKGKLSQKIYNHHNTFIKMNNHWYRMIPIFFHKKRNNAFRILVEKVKEMLNITTILLKLENNEKFVKTLSNGEKAYDLSLNRNRLKRIDTNFKSTTLMKESD